MAVKPAVSWWNESVCGFALSSSSIVTGVTSTFFTRLPLQYFMSHNFGASVI